MYVIWFSEPRLSEYLNCVNHMSCNAVVLRCLMEFCRSPFRWDPTFVYTLIQLVLCRAIICFVVTDCKMVCCQIYAAFDNESEIQLLLFC
jgi:hypothetical protein